LNQELIYGVAPGIWPLIVYTNRNSKSILFQPCLKVIDYILQKAKNSVKTTLKHITPICEADNLTVYANAREEFNATGNYFPGRPVINMVTNCMFDVKQGCSKTYKSTGRFGAGLLLFWCANHRHCIGFVLLQSAESPKIVYETLATRFTTLPKFIIYDNGCCLFEYCFNRQPDFFMDTIFLSDGFHWLNHTNCGSFFNSSVYPAINDVCSVTHEQKNTAIAKLKSISIYMRFDSFFEIILYIVHRLNNHEVEKKRNK